MESHAYWNQRAQGYSEVNQEELEGIQRITWKKVLEETIDGRLKTNYGEKRDISVLDIGAGPGFLSIVLSEIGYQVTAADYSEKMLLQAQKNLDSCKMQSNESVEELQIRFCKENAEKLSFSDQTFDVVVSRNLTWNLEHPQVAYKEWLRVLKPGGLLLVFDANWYTYLQDEEDRKAYEADRKNVAQSEFEDYNIGENFDKMEEIARNLPMTAVFRPQWDKEFLSTLEVSHIDIVQDIGERVYSPKEKLNYQSRPMFMIAAVKGDKHCE